MPQNNDGSAIIYLLWLAWIYWRFWIATRSQQQREIPDDFPARAGGETSAGADGSHATLEASQAKRDGQYHDLSSALFEIERLDPSFSVERFLKGACAAYETITAAFASGDRNMLENCSSREVYDDFVGAINERERRGEHVQTSLVRIFPPEIVAARLDGDKAEVSVRFVSELFNVTRSASGAVVHGNPKACTEAVDVWTFAKRPAARDPIWKLVASNAA